MRSFVIALSMLSFFATYSSDILAQNLMDRICREELVAIADPARAFVKAAECGDVEYVRHALDKGLPVETSERGSGSTAMHLAAMRGKLDIVVLLLKRGANADAVAAGSTYTPLIHAAVGGHLAVVNLLLDRGANPNVEYVYGTPLIAAVNHRRLETITTLLRRGARVNHSAKSRRGETALHTAVSRQEGWQPIDTQIVHALIAAGADPKATNARGMTAMQVARPEARALLETAGWTSRK